MPESRYAIPSSSSAQAHITDSRVSSMGSGSTATSSSATQNSTQNTSSSEKYSQTQKNMTAADQAALDRLIQQLLNGGTPEIQQQKAVRAGEVATVGNIREGYSKEAAFGDSAGLVSQQMRRVLEQLLPSINRAAEDAGSSGGALRALLLQDAASKAAESSSALGVQTAAQYGQISTGLSQVLENLTRIDPASTTALINALNVSKGSVSTTTGTKMGNSTTTGSTTTNQSQVSNTTENKNVNTDYAPYSNMAPVAPGGSSFGQFGPSADSVNPGKYVGTTLDTLSQLTGAGNPWAQYSF